MNLFKKTTESSRNGVPVNKKKIIALSGKSVKTDWLIMLGVLVVSLLVVIVWSIVQYFMLGKEVTQNTSQAQTKEIIKTEKLQRVVEKYNTRSAQFSVLVPGFQFYAVPSTERTQELLEQDVFVATSSVETTQDEVTEEEIVTASSSTTSIDTTVGE